GATFDPDMEGKMRISVVATGIDSEAAERPRPVLINTMTNPPRVTQTVDEPEEDVVTQEPLLAAIEHSMRDSDGTEVTAEETSEDTVIEMPEAPKAAPQPVAREAVAEPAAAPQERPYIPRAPATAKTPAAVRPDPMAEADMMNGGGGAGDARKTGPSLFSKVTGQSWMRRGPEAADSPAEPVAQKAPEAPRPKLSGMSPSERPSKSSADDDLLEIPAFLRRQAN
ncbi:MAG: hypothetical protein RLN80_13105, partial [Rhodospirillales bacterium]